MEQHKIDRINALAAKARSTEGLTEAELAERDALRREYVDAHKESLMAQLHNTYVIGPDGKKRRVKRKDEKEEG
ncbi:MAG: DUF896 domain-containing protein [Oscillospiraceae bacterium]|nr:DUF896 domain-containing protein [Oscillospiraceae bacterium]